MIVSQTTKILEVVLYGMGIHDLVSIAMNRIIAGIECDIVLLYGSQRIPCSAIEVKKPGRQRFEEIVFSSSSDDTKDAGLVAGQHFDQLCALECMGYTSLYGMISNGNKWMLTTGGSADSFSEEQKDWSTMKDEIRLYAQTPEQDMLQVEKGQVTERSALDRCLNVSQLVSVSESEDLIKLIATFLRLACRPLSEKKSMPNLSKMSCRV
jgi:hypothetical protein